MRLQRLGRLCCSLKPRCTQPCAHTMPKLKPMQHVGSCGDLNVFVTSSDAAHGTNTAPAPHCLVRTMPSGSHRHRSRRHGSRSRSPRRSYSRSPSSRRDRKRRRRGSSSTRHAPSKTNLADLSLEELMARRAQLLAVTGKSSSGNSGASAVVDSRARDASPRSRSKERTSRHASNGYADTPPRGDERISGRYADTPPLRESRVSHRNGGTPPPRGERVSTRYADTPPLGDRRVSNRYADTPPREEPTHGAQASLPGGIVGSGAGAGAGAGAGSGGAAPTAQPVTAPAAGKSRWDSSSDSDGGSDDSAARAKRRKAKQKRKKRKRAAKEKRRAARKAAEALEAERRAAAAAASAEQSVGDGAPDALADGEAATTVGGGGVDGVAPGAEGKALEEAADAAPKWIPLHHGCRSVECYERLSVLGHGTYVRCVVSRYAFCVAPHARLAMSV